jgi:very-short-patch-repair endonuclease
MADSQMNSLTDFYDFNDRLTIKIDGEDHVVDSIV